MSDNPIICGHCRKPIHKDETKRHYGFYSAHLESRCRELLQMDITALREENARLRGALEECRDVLSENVMYLPEPGQAANAIAYAEKLLKVEE